MRILITGITGFVGSHLADLMLSSGHEVHGTQRVNSRHRNIGHIKNKIKLHEVDVTDFVSLDRVIKEVMPEQIYHLAALSWVTPSWKMPSAYMQVNAVGTINLFEALLNNNHKPRVLVSCTPEEFGDVDKEELPITEKTRIHPINPYAASKVAQDAVCTSYFASYNIPIIRTRGFNHEGPRRDINGANASFAYQVAKIEAGLQPPIIYHGNIEATRNFCDVRDMVKGYELAMEKGEPGELYLIGSDQIHTMEECLNMLIAKSKMADKIKTELDPKRVRPTELLTFIADCSKFKKKTGWEITIPFEKTMEDVLNYWREFVKNEKLLTANE